MDRQLAWKRFSSRHLGKWSGRSTHVNVRTMEQVRFDAYEWNMENQPTFAEYEVRTTGVMSENGWSCEVQYQMGSPGFYVFEDGCYCAQHEMLELHDVPLARLAVELCITVTATERMRCFLLYDFESMLRRVIMMNEVRDDLWEDRNPSSLLSLVGRWRGQTTSARLPALGAGIISYNTESVFLWQGGDTVRESLSVSTTSKNGEDTETIDQITAYGRVMDDGDLTAIDWRGPEMRRTLLLNCATYASAPMVIPPDTPWHCDFNYFATPISRRRIKRLHDKKGSPVSHSNITENRVD